MGGHREGWPGWPTASLAGGHLRAMSAALHLLSRTGAPLPALPSALGCAGGWQRPLLPIFLAEAGRAAAHGWPPARHQRWPEQGFARLSADVSVLRAALGPRALGRTAARAPGAGRASCAGSVLSDVLGPGLIFPRSFGNRSGVGFRDRVPFISN